jgi:acyl-CoA dehydrogenase
MSNGARRARRSGIRPNARKPNGRGLDEPGAKTGGVLIERSLFNEEHEMWRTTVRRFIEKEIVPFHAQWERDGIVPRELWLKAGAQGMLCCTTPEEYGGLGLDYLFDVVVFEELWRVGASGPGFLIHTDLVATYLLTFGTEEQKKTWLPRMVRGEAIGSLGMTEPHAGSDLKAVRTQAVRDGDEFVINGQKVFISNGQLCDLVVLATKTDNSANAKGITLFLVESNRRGFNRGRNLEKLGMKAQDTSELFFENVRVPAKNMLGEEGRGFAIMMAKLAQERLAQAIRSAMVTETVIEWTVDYTAERKAFGQTIADFQNTQFVLADLKARATMARVFTDKCIELFMRGKLDPVEAAMAKMVTSELHCDAVDKCLQLFGGWGYMWEYPISRAYADARVVKIAGGSIEVMKTIIARDMFKNRPRMIGGRG